MRKVHIVRKAVLGIDMPKLKTGCNGKRVQGGHPPVPYRQRTTTWGLANSFARVPQHEVWLD
jgi:hypothetical protein